MLRFYFALMAILTGLGCSTDQLDGEGTLKAIVDGSETVLDNVIACAASNKDDNRVSVFLYPRDGSTNLRYFETDNAQVDKNDFGNYVEKTPPLLDVFNGFLKKFERAVSTEKWVIVSFEEEGKRHLSNPIRLKQNTKPTEYLPQNISIDASTATPSFSWTDGAHQGTKIYFQVVSDAEGDVLSGTYTFERNFRYYELDNVVLNVTKGVPPALKKDTSYTFSLLAVSEDNWVNLFSEVNFDLD